MAIEQAVRRIGTLCFPLLAGLAACHSLSRALVVVPVISSIRLVGGVLPARWIEPERPPGDPLARKPPLHSLKANLELPVAADR